MGALRTHELFSRSACVSRHSLASLTGIKDLYLDPAWKFVILGTRANNAFDRLGDYQTTHLRTGCTFRQWPSQVLYPALVGRCKTGSTDTPLCWRQVTAT
jgi:hypothetical protein